MKNVPTRLYAKKRTFFPTENNVINKQTPAFNFLSMSYLQIIAGLRHTFLEDHTSNG